MQALGLKRIENPASEAGGENDKHVLSLGCVLASAWSGNTFDFRSDSRAAWLISTRSSRFVHISVRVSHVC